MIKPFIKLYALKVLQDFILNGLQPRSCYILEYILRSLNSLGNGLNYSRSCPHCLAISLLALAGPSGCDRRHMSCQTWIFTIWTFTEKVLSFDLEELQIHANCQIKEYDHIVT